MTRIYPEKEIPREKSHVVWNRVKEKEYNFIFVGSKREREEDFTKMTEDIRKYGYLKIERNLTGRVENSKRLRYILLTIESDVAERFVEECLTKRPKFRDTDLREKEIGRGGLLSVDVYAENNYGPIDVKRPKPFRNF